MKSIAKIFLAALAAIAITTSTVKAQTDATTSTNSSAATPAKKPKSKRYAGKIASIDTAAKTIEVDGVSRNTFTITSKTKIKKDGQPATLEDAAVGEHVTIMARENASGDLVARTLNIGKSKAKTAPAAETTTPPASPVNPGSTDK